MLNLACLEQVVAAGTYWVSISRQASLGQQQIARQLDSGGGRGTLFWVHRPRPPGPSCVGFVKLLLLVLGLLQTSRATHYAIDQGCWQACNGLQ